jgi:transcriptional regulator with XRE-family HTH domain
MGQLKNQELLDKFGAHVRKLRSQRDMTLEELAYASDIELSQVHRIEKGRTNLSLSTVEAIAKGLNISIAELLRDF